MAWLRRKRWLFGPSPGPNVTGLMHLPIDEQNELMPHQSLMQGISVQSIIPGKPVSDARYEELR